MGYYEYIWGIMYMEHPSKPNISKTEMKYNSHRNMFG